MSDHALTALRQADPAPARTVENRPLFEAIVATPGESRLAGPAQPRRRLRRRRYLVSLVAVVGLTVGTAWGASGGSPLAIFSANPQDDGGSSSPGSPWHQSVIPASVHPVGAATIPGVGNAVFWWGRTHQGGWCSAIRLPGGGWAGRSDNPLDAGGTIPGCQPSRGLVNAAGAGGPVYLIDGFDYNEVDLDARAEGHGFWRIYFGEVTAKTPVAKVIDRRSGREAPVADGHRFVFAIPTAHPGRIGRLHLVAVDGSGRVVADDG